MAIALKWGGNGSLRPLSTAPHYTPQRITPRGQREISKVSRTSSSYVLGRLEWASDQFGLTAAPGEAKCVKSRQLTVAPLWKQRSISQDTTHLGNLILIFFSNKFTSIRII
ncbi:hypothetical protein CEXT_807171 [Caerostris extrusa]|uniref:Uncharacterized protein n=1 Tax=Caerostris extrusa TaxID=172846 RepID=A0AAV4RX07_CAEEX|nr:hypothetical protein CEXT_807171 [Caerostris extrusa]